MAWWGFKLKSSSKQISCLTNYARKYQVCWLVDVFLWNLQKFSEHIFWRTSANEYFSIYANDSTIYIVFVHFVVPLYENMYQRKVLFLTFMNSSFFYTSFFFCFHIITNVLFTKLEHDYRFITSRLFITHTCFWVRMLWRIT